MNKTLNSLVIGVVTLSTVATATPVFAKNDNNNGRSQNSKSNNSVVNFFKSSDDDKGSLKTLINKNQIKIQTVGPGRLKDNVDVKFKWHEGDDNLKIRVPKGTFTSSSEAFLAAVKAAYSQYRTTVSTARKTFLDAVAAARAAYITSSTPATNTPPTVQTAASANPTNVTGTTTNLSVLGADNGGEGNLVYTWSVSSKPGSAADPTFSVNSTNAAKNTVATFSSSGSYTLLVTIKDAGNLTVTSAVSVNVNLNNGPTIQTAAAASPSPVSGTTTTLSVLGADDGGEGSLTYTWLTTAKPASSANPTFSVNGNNAAKNTVATFTSAGNYTFQVTITDSNSLSVISSVSVTVNQTLSSVTVSPATITVAPTSTTQFNAFAFDQFNASQPSTFFWSIFEGVLGGSISSTGLYTASSTTGTYHIIGTSNVDTTKKATSTVTVQ